MRATTELLVLRQVALCWVCMMFAWACMVCSVMYDSALHAILLSYVVIRACDQRGLVPRSSTVTWMAATNNKVSNVLLEELGDVLRSQTN